MNDEPDVKCGLRILRRAILEADDHAADEAAMAYADAHANDLPAAEPTVEQRAAMHDCTPAPAVKPYSNEHVAAAIAAYNVAVVDMVAKACGLPSIE